MSKFSSGEKSKAISDRSGLAFPYNEMIKEWNGSFVHKSEFDAKHPQLEPRPHSGDAQALKDARPDRTEPVVATLLGINAFKTANAGTSVITVTERSHGRSSSDTVRFRNVVGFDGITITNVTRSAGYTITKVDDDTYTFTVSTDTATVGNINGGGGLASAGPVTLTA